jgi:hypothetical protein
MIYGIEGVCRPRKRAMDMAVRVVHVQRWADRRGERALGAHLTARRGKRPAVGVLYGRVYHRPCIASVSVVYIILLAVPLPVLCLEL